MLKAQKLSTLLVAVLLILGMAPWVFAQATPSLTVGDQGIVDDTVMIDQVVSNGPGWIVIHADDNGEPGEVIGYEAVTDGESNDVAVEIDPDMATETLYAILYTDAGTEGEFEPDGDDIGVEVNDEILTESFTVTGLAAPGEQIVPSLTVGDQGIEDDTVMIDQVISDGPGWIVIHADDNGAPGEVIGFEAVTDGENNDVAVEIDPDMATETLYVMLHTDAGTEGTYEFPGDDTPVQVDGEAVVETFTVTGLAAPDEQVIPSLTVGDQGIENDTVTIDQVVSDGPGWIVIHADDNGAPGEVIGFEAVADGENNDVVVEIDPDMATDTLYAMLHTDVGTEGTFEFPGDDAPVQVDGAAVVEPFTVTEEPVEMPETGGVLAPSLQVTPMISVTDQSVDDGILTVETVVSDGPGWVVVHADDNGAPGEVIGFEAVPDGESTDVDVEIDTDLLTDTLYVMLHTDAGTEGTYEFPGDDVPVEVDGEAVVQEVEVIQEIEPLPETGGLPAPWMWILIASGILLVGAGILIRRS